MAYPTDLQSPAGSTNYNTRQTPQIHALSYRCRARHLLSSDDLHQLLEHARRNNLLNGITGVLVVHENQLFQWIEGPIEAVERLWTALSTDSRLEGVELLGRTRLPMRLFSNWDMQLGLHRTSESSANEESIEISTMWLESMQGAATSQTRSWGELSLEAVHPARNVHVVSGTAIRIPHGHQPILLSADTDAVQELVARLLGPHAGAAAVFLANLHTHGLSAETMFLDVFEPTAKLLGNLWLEDECTELEVTIALSLLQNEVRKWATSFQSQFVAVGPSHSILIATQPGEQHMLALGLSSEFFWRAGWDVTCSLPHDDDELVRLVCSNTFEVIDLSLSTAMRRMDKLGALAETIRRIRDAARNPRLQILVHGRIFSERPELQLFVGADAGGSTLSRVVQLTESLVIAASRPPYQLAQHAIRRAGLKVHQGAQHLKNI